MAFSKVKFDSQGRITIPKELRAGFSKEETFVARLENGALVLEPRTTLLKKMQERYKGDGSLVEELRLLRRQESARDEP